ncbi:MAG: CPBP family glutamic-type intramembrane protease [Anaerovoracaceae bacterium]|nr:CPBP family glutamic-type intramembrane protease [Anaerovoracaceae bacterium]
MSAAGFGAAVLYGGIVEKILMRLFLMSLISFILWKLFFRNTSKNKLPDKIFISANIISALLFAAGHLPATAAAFGALTPMLLARCFLLNGIFGLLFGRLYRRYGIWYAMAAHMLVHIVSKAVWLILI